MTRINAIYARSSNGAIGFQNALPWHLPEDLANFRKLTVKSTVIMGRKTWDSLPPRFRPLPDRTNIVVTRQVDWQEPGGTRAHGLTEALEMARQSKVAEAWLIGGAELFRKALEENLIDRVLVTQIHQDYKGDVFMPALSDWQKSSCEFNVSAAGIPFSFLSLEKPV